jgi:hypothetical protein
MLFPIGPGYVKSGAALRLEAGGMLVEQIIERNQRCS